MNRAAQMIGRLPERMERVCIENPNVPLAELLPTLKARSRELDEAANIATAAAILRQDLCADLAPYRTEVRPDTTLGDALEAMRIVEGPDTVASFRAKYRRLLDEEARENPASGNAGHIRRVSVGRRATLSVSGLTGRFLKGPK